MELGKFKETVRDSRGRGGWSGEGERGRLIAHKGTEGGGINGRVVADIMSKFSGGEVISPVVLAN